MVRHGQSEANVMKLVSSIYSVSVANHGLTPLGRQQASDAATVFEEAAAVAPPSHDILGSKVALPQQFQAEKVSPDSTPPGQPLLFNPCDLSNVLFYVSDFKRAYETGHFLKLALEKKHRQALEDQEKAQKPTNGGLGLYTPAFVPETPPDAKKPSELNVTPAPLLVPFYSTPALRERFFGVFEGACPSDSIYDKVWAQDKANEPDSDHFGVESIQNVVSRTTELILDLENTWSDKIIILVSHGDVAQILLSVCAAIDPRFHRSLPHMENCDVRELLFVSGAEQEAVEPAVTDNGPQHS